MKKSMLLMSFLMTASLFVVSQVEAMQTAAVVSGGAMACLNMVDGLVANGLTATGETVKTVLAEVSKQGQGACAKVVTLAKQMATPAYTAANKYSSFEPHTKKIIKVSSGVVLGVCILVAAHILFPTIVTFANLWAHVLLLPTYVQNMFLFVWNCVPTLQSILNFPSVAWSYVPAFGDVVALPGAMVQACANFMARTCALAANVYDSVRVVPVRALPKI